eukprot:1510163-Rhodomonas_salina.1
MGGDREIEGSREREREREGRAGHGRCSRASSSSSSTLFRSPTTSPGPTTAPSFHTTCTPQFLKRFHCSTPPDMTPHHHRPT